MAGYDRLTPEGKKFYAEVNKLAENQVFVGFQAGKALHESSGKSVDMAQVAAWNELGTSRIPARPFLRQTVDSNESEIAAMCEKAAKSIANGGNAEQALKQIGAVAVSMVQKTIVSGSFEPNAQSTVMRKGSDRPLIDTGQMRQSVHYVIKPKGE